MKILHVGPVKPTHGATGPSHSIRGLAKAQHEIGLQVGLLSQLPLTPGVKMEATPGVIMLHSPSRMHLNPWLISQNWITYIQTKFGIPDIVNFHSVYTPFHVALARRCRQLRWPYIVTPRGGMTCLAQKIKRTKKIIANFLFFRSYVKHATGIHALCPREAEEIQTLFGVNKVIIVPNGVEDYLLEAHGELQRANLGNFGHKDDLILGFVGRIYVYHKGLDLLLKAMAILKSKYSRSRYSLFLVGPFHTMKDKHLFCSAVESLNLKDVVKLIGPKYGDEKLCHFLACDVFVHPSRFEGMPMSVLEAMALGRPCLVTPGTNMADVVCEGGGWKCEPDPRSIAEALKAIYEQRNLLEALGRQSHELIRNRFTWRKIAQRLKNEYTKIIEEIRS